MMENKQKRYELVAWTRMTENGKDHQLRLIPSLHLDAQYDYITEAAECHRAARGRKDIETFVGILVKSARYHFVTGEYGEGIRFLRTAASKCLNKDFDYYYGEFHRMAVKYRREDILMEEESLMLKKKKGKQEDIFL